MKSIGFFIGSRSSFNVRRLLSNLGWMLQEQENVALVTTNPASYGPEITDNFEIYGGDYSATVAGSWRALAAYACEQDPAMLTQLTDPPVHGTLVGSICQRYEIPSVYRYGGDRFYEWRVAQGRNRAKAFAIGNVLNRLALELADECITFGPNGTARLTDRGIDPSKIQVLPPSVEVERFRQTVKQPPLDVPDDRHILLSVGRITYLKGAATMERVIPQILDKRRDLQFVFVGPEQRHIDVSEYRDNVTMVGAVDPKRMPQYYQQADLLVHPSLTDGIPRAVLEALASRTPVLSRNVGDVATVTDNTFSRDQMLIDLVSDFEMLELDAIKPFSRESLRPQYVDFIESHRR